MLYYIFSTGNVPFHSIRKMNRNMSTLFSMAAGVGLLAGTTGALLYHYFLGRRYVFILEQDINHLHLSLANLKNEFEEMQ